MKNKLRNLVNNAPVVLLVVVGLIIAFTNYRFGTYLSGWDTLHPEFNLGLYFERTFFGAWQEHQGLGAPASQAHAAELSRMPLLFLLDLVLPNSMVRYAFFMLMYICGGLGAYTFIRRSWFEHQTTKEYDWAATLGGLLFLLNLGTLQHFYVPLEMFAVHFATIGFVLHSLHQAIKHPSAKNYAVFFIFQFLSSASAHTATLFYMYTATIFIYAAILGFLTWKNKLRAFQQLIILAMLTIAANFFWIGPNLYYILRHSDYVKEAKITRQFSSEAFWQNQAFGEIQDVLIFKNFLFNWKDFEFSSGTFEPLFNEWQSHLENVGYPYLFLVAFICLVGLVVSFTQKDRRHSLALLSLFLIPVFFINNLNFPSNNLFIWVQSLSDTLSEALRFPFTKFSILLMLSMSVYFAQFVGLVLSHFKKIATKNDYKYFLVGSLAILSLLIIIPTFPVFTGNLISPNMKVVYPNEYKQLFEWFETQPRQARIAKFPLVNQFGWTYNRWPTASRDQGYQGAGFIWFGLPQPTLDREFDRWSASNEYLYYELSHAVDHNDAEEFRRVLAKYNVSWLLFDESAFDTNSQFKKQYKETFDRLLAQTNAITLAQEFDFLKVYKVEHVNNSSWVGSTPTTTVFDALDRVKADVIFAEEGNYITSSNSPVSYPFAQLKQETTQQYNFQNEELVARAISSTGGVLSLPAWTEESKTIPVEVYAQLTEENALQLSVHSLLPEIRLNGETTSLRSYAPQQSLTYYLPLPNAEDTYILKLSNSYIIFQPTTEPLFFGSFAFPVDTIPVELYTSTALSTERLIDGNTYTGRNCFDQQTSPEITASRNGDYLFLYAYRNTACATKNEFHSIPGKGLVSLEYNYRSTTPNTFTRVCLYKKGKDGCINQDEYYIDVAAENEKTIQVFEPIEEAGEINVSFDLSSETDGKNIEYSKATLAFYPHIETLQITASSLASLAPRAISLDLKPNTIISIAQPYGREQELLTVKDLNEVATAQNCSSEGDTLITAQNDKHVLTAEKKGIACEHFLFDNIVPSQEYVATITANNVQGKELLVHLLESEQVLVDEVFGKGIQTHNFWVNNQRKSDDLQLSLEAHSYGKYKSINELLEIAVAPFPVSYVSKMRVEDSQNRVEYAAADSIEANRKTNFWYTVKIDASEESIVYLSQTFDNGWRAFSGVRVLPHFIYNSWANAWVVPAGEYTITLFYVPQLLEFSGIALLLSSSLLAWIHFEFKPRDFFVNQPISKYKEIKAKITKLLEG